MSKHKHIKVGKTWATKGLLKRLLKAHRNIGTRQLEPDVVSTRYTISKTAQGVRDFIGRDYDCLLTLSGGIDSTVLLHHLLEGGKKPLCVYVDYGTKSREAELKCANLTVEEFGIELVVIPFPFYTENVVAAILDNTKEVEIGAQWWLEGRNAIIGMILAVFASERNLPEIYIGINASDSRGDYIDTDARFVAALNSLITCSCRKPVKVYAPWVDIDYSKIDVINYGNLLGVDWMKTHSCSNGRTKPCCDYYGCESCKSRREEFEMLDLKDPWMPNYD